MRSATTLSGVRVLVTDGEWRPALAALRSLARCGAEVDVLAETPWAVSFASRYCGRRIVTPPEDDGEAWLNAVAKAVREGRYDAIVLCGNGSASAVSEHRDLFESHVRLLLPEKGAMRTALNKSSTLRAAQEAGVPVPRTLFPAGVDDVMRIAGDLVYPMVVKGTRGSGSSQVRYASSAQALVQRYRELAELAPAEEPPVLQELVQGEGVNFAGLFREGEPVAHIMWRRIREYPMTGGPSAVAQSIDDPELAEHALTLLRALRWTGLAMVEFKRDGRDGTPRLMEINPRFWGSMELAMRCGLDLPRLYVEACLGRSITDPGYEVGRRMSFLFPHGLLLASASPVGPLNLLSDLVRPRSSCDVCLDDLRTLPRQLLSTYREFGRQMRTRTLRHPTEL